jgi:hypothetical protein
MSAPTFNVTLVSALTVVETLVDPYLGPGLSTVTTNGLNETVVLTGVTVPPITAQAAFQQALSGGAATIDLTALPGLTPSETVNGTGLKVQAIKLRGLSTNANKIVVSQGAANPYRLDGATAWSIPLLAGQSVLIYVDAGGEVIGGSHKNIDLAGTGSQVLEVEIVMG